VSGISDSEPQLDRRGRPRSSAIAAGRQGRPSKSRGRKLPAEVLTEAEVQALFEAPRAAVGSRAIESRDLAALALIYRAGFKWLHIRALETRHYREGRPEILVPAASVAQERSVPLDHVTREYLDAWMADRLRLGIRPIAPLFCIVKGETFGDRVDSSSFRSALRTRALRANVHRRVTTEGLRKSGRAHLGAPPSLIESRIVSYLDQPGFNARHEQASEKWQGALALYQVDPRKHATRIGHDCREAMIEFVTSLGRHRKTELPGRPEQTVQRLKAIIAATTMSPAVADNAEALLLVRFSRGPCPASGARRITRGRGSNPRRRSAVDLQPDVRDARTGSHTRDRARHDLRRR